MDRLRKAAHAYAKALDDGVDIKRTASRLKKLSKLVDPEDIVMLVDAWIAAQNRPKGPPDRPELRLLKRRTLRKLG
jgi:hypothetical protein